MFQYISPLASLESGGKSGLVKVWMWPGKGPCLLS